jgi:transketolase
MRSAFIQTLFELAAHDSRIALLTADMGYSVFEKFEAAYPERFVNVGIAESNMIGLAAGMALSGFKVFAYSIVPFATMRCFEQIRVDICYQNLPVTVVGVGGGLAYGSAGGTHQSLEDVALMRALPGMAVSSPGDPAEARLLTRFAAAHDGPMYIRLGKNGENLVHANLDTLTHGRAITMREGRDLTMAATGTMLETALQVADLLKSSGIEARVLSFPFLKPMDRHALESAVDETGLIVSLEEHSVIGGLGSAICELVAEMGRGRVKRVGLADAFVKDIGSQKYLRSCGGLAPEQVRDTILAALATKR